MTAERRRLATCAHMYSSPTCTSPRLHAHLTGAGFTLGILLYGKVAYNSPSHSIRSRGIAEW